MIGSLIALAGTLFALVSAVNAWRRIERMTVRPEVARAARARVREAGSRQQIDELARGLSEGAPLRDLLTVIAEAPSADEARAGVNEVLGRVDAELRLAIRLPGPAARVALTTGVLGAVVETIRAMAAGPGRLGWALAAMGIGGGGAVLALEASRRLRRSSERLRADYDGTVSALEGWLGPGPGRREPGGRGARRGPGTGRHSPDP